jgi:hypothetical protein
VLRKPLCKPEGNEHVYHFSMRSRQKLNFYFLLHQMELPAKGVGMMLNLFLKEQINDIIIIITVDHPFQLAAPTPPRGNPLKGTSSTQPSLWA